MYITIFKKGRGGGEGEKGMYNPILSPECTTVFNILDHLTVFIGSAMIFIGPIVYPVHCSLCMGYYFIDQNPTTIAE